jgi:hypothetical protein
MLAMERMTARKRRVGGMLAMGLGPLLILGSPWMVLHFPPMHGTVYNEGWGYIGPGQCEWFSQLSDSAVIGWSAVMMAAGVAATLTGLWLFRSARSS